MRQKVLYLHGLESPQGGEKVEFLATKCLIHAPEMDYTRDGIFSTLIETVEKLQPDLIIGSSMGGYAAYVLGGLYKIPVLAFNPALHSRSFDPNFPKFTNFHHPDTMTIVLGEEDNLIQGVKTKEWLKDHIKDRTVNYNIESISKMGHRVPLNVFIDMYNKIN